MEIMDTIMITNITMTTIMDMITVTATFIHISIPRM
jgi:hypothetical protein